MDRRTALTRAADILSREEVECAIGLDDEFVEGHTFVEEGDSFRPYTEADLAADLAEHSALVATLREIAAAPERALLASDIVGQQEIAERLGVTRKIVWNWADRSVGFPEPVLTLSAGRFWSWSEVRAWHIHRYGKEN